MFLPQMLAMRRKAAGETITRVDLDVSTLTTDALYDPGYADLAAARGISATADGTQIIISDRTDNVFYGYDLAPDWDYSDVTGTADSTSVNFSSTFSRSQLSGMHLLDDMKTLYMFSGTNDIITKYVYSTAGDFTSTPTEDSFEDVTNEFINDDCDIWVSNDETRLYVGFGDFLWQFTFGTAGDVSTINPRVALVSLAQCAGIWFQEDGSKFWTVDKQFKEIEEYTVSTNWNISSGITKVDSYTFSSGASGTNFHGLYVTPDGHAITVDKSNNGIVVCS